MKLTVREDTALDDIEVTIDCPHVDARVRRIIDACETAGEKLFGISDGFVRSVDMSEVLYAETVDGKTFLYTQEEVLESPATIGDLEAAFAGTEVIRATRQMLVNLRHVKGLRPYLNARLELVMDNGEHIIASRQFARDIKKRLGL